MDFFSRQDHARKKTRFLVFMFVLAVIIIILSIYAVWMTIIIQSEPSTAARQPFTWNRAWDSNAFLAVAGFVLAAVSIGSGVKISQLRGGGRIVASSLGGRLLQPNTANFREKRILNIVEEMAIASGVPIPPVYLMEKEKGINAFAAGFRSEDAVIGVTQGMLDFLNRDEQQGVIAHEFSHILNGDMRMNIRLMGVLHGILVISMIGYVMMRIGGRTAVTSKKEGAAVGVGIAGLGLTLYIIGYVGVFFGNLIKSAVSRQREYLADASAVQFTRNPFGIGNALKKIGGLVSGSRIRHPHAAEASHLFFGNGIRSHWFSMLATHPPLEERIRRIDPRFDGTFPEVTRLEGPDSRDKTPAAGKKKAKKQKAPLDVIPIPGLPEAIKYPVLAHLAQEPSSIQELAGNPHPEHLQAARAILENIPPTLRKACEKPADAKALLCCLLMDEDPDKQAAQWEILNTQASGSLQENMKTYLPYVAMLGRKERLPLAELATSGIRGMEMAAYDGFRSLIHALVYADEEVNLFEYTLLHLVTQVLDVHFNGPRKSETNLFRIEEVSSECACILSALARIGHEEDDHMTTAFRAAVSTLPGKLQIDLLGWDACTLDDIDNALNKLRALAPRLKKPFVTACFTCVTHDGTITPDEGELFRAVSLALDCPLPPWLGHD